jgi:hypothetical protein
MKNSLTFICKLIIFILSFGFLSANANAGDRLPAGSKLKVESYVFTVEEASNLMRTIEELEFKVSKQDEAIKIYKQIDQVSQEEKAMFVELLSIRNDQINLYKEWIEADAARIRSLERQQKVTKFLTMGIVLSGGAIIVADKLDDRVLENN